LLLFGRGAATLMLTGSCLATAMKIQTLE